MMMQDKHAIPISSCSTICTTPTLYGVSSFITKPVPFSGLVDAMNVLGRYWFEIVESPPVP